MNEIEAMITDHAKASGFRLVGVVNNGLRVYYRDSPEASVRLRLADGESAMLRGVAEFDRWLEKAFDK